MEHGLGDTQHTQGRHTVLERRDLAGGSFILRFERKDMVFSAGQYISVGCWNDLNRREYSIYSGTGENFLEILVKIVDGGLVSRRLSKLDAGDFVHVEGPFGYFIPDEQELAGPLLLVATGTGISPFHSMVLSHPGIDFRLIHGVRTLQERLDSGGLAWGEGGNSRYMDCVSREGGGSFHGRVTDYLRDFRPVAGLSCFLCGNCDMIYDVFDILRKAGVASPRIHTEVYF